MLRLFYSTRNRSRVIQVSTLETSHDIERAYIEVVEEIKKIRELALQKGIDVTCCSYLWPLRLNDNCFPGQYRGIMYWCRGLELRGILECLLWGSRSIAETLPKILYRYISQKVRDISIGVHRDVGNSRVNDKGGMQVLLIDHPRGLAGGESKVDKEMIYVQSGYFPVLERIEIEDGVRLKRLYLASERDKLPLSNSERITRLLGVVKVARIIFENLCIGCRLANMLFMTRCNTLKSKIILVNAIASQLSFKSIEAYLVGEVIGLCLSEDKSIRCICTTFEGHPYERVVSRLAREKRIEHIAYQHVPLAKFQNATLELPTSILPTKILCTSYAYYNSLSLRYREEVRSGQLCIGMAKDDGLDNGDETDSLKRGWGNRDVLLLPNGDSNEVKRLLEWCKEIHASQAISRFGIKFHPAAIDEHMKVLKRFLRVSHGFPIVIESGGIEELACLYSFGAYISSSVAVKFAAKGVVPICISGQGSYNDPLFSADLEALDIEQRFYSGELLICSEEALSKVARIIYRNIQVTRSRCGHSKELVEWIRNA